jgi:hypothetical protein
MKQLNYEERMKEGKIETKMREGIERERKGRRESG